MKSSNSHFAWHLDNFCQLVPIFKTETAGPTNPPPKKGKMQGQQKKNEKCSSISYHVKILCNVLKTEQLLMCILHIWSIWINIELLVEGSDLTWCTAGKGLPLKINAQNIFILNSSRTRPWINIVHYTEPITSTIKLTGESGAET